MRALVLSLCCLLFASCISSDSARPEAVFTPQGPPRVQPEVVARHAEQFETDLASRPPGSQEEFAAASYLTAHLQQAGYSVRLESVPVADTVRSSDVIAVPPSGEQPEVIVTVSFDTPIGDPDADGSDIGAFLELARALRVATDDHSIEFVALGAQSDDMLGARRLARLLLDEEVRARIVHLASTEREAALVGPLEDAGFPVERFVGDGADIATAVFAVLTNAEG